MLVQLHIGGQRLKAAGQLPPLLGMNSDMRLFYAFKDEPTSADERPQKRVIQL